MNTDRGKDLLKRIMSAVILFVIYSLIMIDVDIFRDRIDFFVRTGIAVIVTLIYYFISTKYLKISYDNKGLDRSIVIFLTVNFVFCFMAGSMGGGFYGAYLSVFMYAYIGLTAFVIIRICRFIKRKIQGDRAYQQAAEDLDSGGEEVKDITGEN